MKDFQYIADSKVYFTPHIFDKLDDKDIDCIFEDVIKHVSQSQPENTSEQTGIVDKSGKNSIWDFFFS